MTANGHRNALSVGIISQATARYSAALSNCSRLYAACRIELILVICTACRPTITASCCSLIILALGASSPFCPKFFPPCTPIGDLFPEFSCWSARSCYSL